MPAYAIRFSGMDPTPRVGPLPASRLVLGEGSGYSEPLKPVLAAGVDPEATSYRAVAAPGGGLVLVPGDEDLVGVFPHNAYRRGQDGRSRIVAGGASPVASHYAYFGHRGGLGGFTDTLYRVSAPALLEILPSRRLGRTFYAVLVPGEAPRVYERVEALALLVAGTDPQLSALVAAWDGRPEEFGEALRLAEQVKG